MSCKHHAPDCCVNLTVLFSPYLMTTQSLASPILLVGVIVLPSICFGQAGRAELFGAIRDPAGLPAPKAKVEAEDQATMVRYSAVSDECGEYHVLGLPAGQYVLR